MNGGKNSSDNEMMLNIRKIVKDIKVKNEEVVLPDIIQHVHELKQNNPNLKETTVEEQYVTANKPEPRTIKFWEIDDVMAEHWLKSLKSGPENWKDKSARYAHLDPKERAELFEVQSPPPGFPHFKDPEDVEAANTIELIKKHIASTLQMMYKLADNLQLDPDSEEAQIFNAAFEAMGVANYFTKRVDMKVEAEKIADPILRRYAVESWENQPGTLFDPNLIDTLKSMQIDKSAPLFDPCYPKSKVTNKSELLK